MVYGSFVLEFSDFCWNWSTCSIIQVSMTVVKYIPQVSIDFNLCNFILISIYLCSYFIQMLVEMMPDTYHCWILRHARSIHVVASNRFLFFWIIISCYVSALVSIWCLVSVFHRLSSMNHVLERNACLDWHWVLQNYGEHVNFANTTLWSFTKSDEPPWFCRTHCRLKHTKNAPFFVLKLAIHLNNFCCENRRWWTLWEKVLMDGAFGTFC